MTETPKIEQRSAQPYLGVRREVTDGVRRAVDTAFPELFGWLSEHGVHPAGSPFIRYHELDRAREPLELEAAVPVAEAVQGKGTVSAGVLPAGSYVTLLHVGPYSSDLAPDLGDARERLVRWTAGRGIVYSRPTDRGSALPSCAEHLRVGPVDEPDWTKWETEFAYLILE